MDSSEVRWKALEIWLSTQNGKPNWVFSDEDLTKAEQLAKFIESGLSEVESKPAPKRRRVRKVDQA